MTTDVITTPTKKAVKAAKAATVKAPAVPAGPAIEEIRRLGVETIEIPVIGTAPLLVHRFSEKAKLAMLNAMQGVAKVKENKNPEAEFEAAFYRFIKANPDDADRFGFPAIGFKDCTVSAARYYKSKSVSMVMLKQVIFIGGEIGADGQKLVEIMGEPAIMREDVVRVGQGGTDLRYRPQYTNWHATLRVRYVTSQLSRASVLSLVDAGGFGVGVGEWRPERGGDMGTFTIDENRELVAITG